MLGVVSSHPGPLRGFQWTVVDGADKLHVCPAPVGGDIMVARVAGEEMGRRQRRRQRRRDEETLSKVTTDRAYLPRYRGICGHVIR